MYYVFEAIFIGIYSCIIFIILSSSFIHKYFLLLFLTGFFKHFFGYFLGLQTYYCNYGYACNKKNHETSYEIHDKISTNNISILTVESVFEGIVFIIIGTITNAFIKHKILSVFFVGFILHIISEILGIHSYFCENRC